MKILVSGYTEELKAKLSQQPFAEEHELSYISVDQINKQLSEKNLEADLICFGWDFPLPENFIQQLYLNSLNKAVIIIAKHAEHTGLKAKLLTLPFIGNKVHVFSERADLEMVFTDIIKRRKQQIQFQKMVKSVQKSIPSTKADPQNSKQFLGIIFDAVPLGICLISKELNLIAVNKEAKLMLSLKGEELGTSIHSFLPDILLDAIQRGKALVEGTNQVFEEIVQVVDRDKTYLQLKISHSSNGLLVLLNDVTAQEESKVKLQNFNKNLEELVAARTEDLESRNKELAQFTYVASHDLQEPLRTVINFVELFKQGYANKLDEEGQVYLNFIETACNRMSSLIKGLLDHGRLGDSADLVSVDLNQLLSDIEEDLDMRLKDSKGELHFSELPSINGFYTELRLLLQNLISNGLKFVPEGTSPIIKLRVIEQESSYEIQVEDNGIGIAKNQQDKIFKIFYRAQKRSDYEGTGIGLAHCKKVVDLHYGKIWVNSELGKGATFHVKIPKNLNELVLAKA